MYEAATDESEARDELSMGLLAVAYGAAHFGKSLFWQSSLLFFAFFLTEIVRLQPMTMGLVLAASLVANGAMDWLVGRFARRLLRSARSAAVTQFCGAALAAAAFAMFAASGAPSPPAADISVLLSLLAFGIAYSLCDVPQSALISFVASTESARAKFSAARYVSSGFAVICVAGLFADIIAMGDEAEQGAYFLHSARWLSCVAFGCAAPLLILVWRLAPGIVRARVGSVPDVAIESSKRPPFDIGLFLVISFCASMASSVFSRLEAYFSAYALPTITAGAWTFIVAVSAGNMLSQPMWVLLASRLGAASGLRLAALLMMAASIVFFFCSTAGAIGAIASAAFYGIAWGGMAMMIWTLLSTIAAHDVTQALPYFGAFSFISKLAHAISVFAISALLLASEAREGALIKALMSAAPCAAAVVAMTLSGKVSVVRRSPIRKEKSALG